MKIFKKQIRPILFILFILSINMVLWLTRLRSAFLTNEVIITAITGSSLLMGFMIIFLLSVRNKWIVSIFGGLENVYFWHRILAIANTAFIFVHGFLSTARGLTNIPDVFLLGQANEAGEVARNFFIGLILFALIAKFMKYEHFRYIHRLLIIPYVFALYHGFFTSVVDLFRFDVLSIWMILTSIIGLSSSIYMILFYQRSAFLFKGEIIQKNSLTSNIFELKVKLENPYSFKPGQFAFIKVFAKGVSKDPHPFSISGKEDGFLFFTIKALGDFTSFINGNLETPAKIKVTKPFGDMTFDAKGKQLWIAGGIGLTPFLGYLRSHAEIHKQIHLIYSVQTIEDAVHLDFLNQLAKRNPNFNFTLHDTSKSGYIGIKDEYIDADTTLYMCGPRLMILSLKKQMKLLHPKTPIIYEAFSFTGTLVEDVLKLLKKAFRSKIKNK